MRFRRLGNTDIKVSEVGFGTWTLVTDWWGRTDHPHAMITAALDAGINFIDTAPVYGDRGARRVHPRAATRAVRDDIVITTKCGYDINAERKFPASRRERPQDWRPESIRQAVRRLAAPARHRPHRPLPAAQPAHRAHPRRRPLGGALELKESGKVPRARRGARTRDRLGRRGHRSIDDRPIVSLQTVFNVLEQEPGLTFAAESARRERRGVSLISRVPHASDSLSGKVDDPDTVFPPRRSPRAPQPRQHARQLREGRSALVPLGA